MNKKILNTGAQDFISKNLNTDIMSVLLKKQIFEGVSQKELAEQIESKKKCQKKLPTWFNTPDIYYPKKIHIEQTSSEITAKYKAEITVQNSLIDLTGGLGVDSYFFSKKTAFVCHCETNTILSKIASYNFEKIGVKNIKTINDDGLIFLEKTPQIFDCIYVDPSRRNDAKGKVFLLSDCIPNIPKHLSLLLKKSNIILIKTSPLLDLSSGINELKFVKEIHIVAVENEVKELVWVLQKEHEGDIKIKTVNLKKEHREKFDYLLSEEKKAISKYSKPLTYLYEPNAAILKSGAFKMIGNRLSLQKLNENSHLYTAEEIIDFPGRRFKIKTVIPYQKKALKKLAVKKANITIRNFPDSVSEIRKKFKIQSGGDSYLFFTKDAEGKHIVISCSKIKTAS